MQKAILFILLWLASLPSFAQEMTITGKVLDNESLPLPYATVTIIGTTTGTTSDLDGNYTIRAYPNSVLSFAFIGLKTQQIEVSGRSVINVTMELVTMGIEDVVVVGYGKQSRISMVSSISAITADQIRVSPVSNISHVLAGKVPGVITAQSQGRPGRDWANITIRGGMSLSNTDIVNQAGGEVNPGNPDAPLLLIDGVEVQNAKEFYYLNPNDIESITVLKDASSTAVFGMRGANGVIVVTTKGGKTGKPTITFSSEYNFQVPMHLPDLTNSYETALLFNEAIRNDALSAGSPLPAPRYSEKALQHFRDQDMPYAYPDVNWIDVAMRDYTTAQRYSLNVSGGSDKSTYYVSLGHSFQDGILNTIPNEYYDPQFNFRTYDFRSNYDVSPAKNLKIGLRLSGRVEQEQDLGIGQWNIFRSSMLKTPPYAHPVYNPDGTLSGGTFQNSRWDENAVGHINERGLRKLYDTRLSSQINIDYDLNWLVKGLSAKVMLSYKNNFSVRKQWNDLWGGFAVQYDDQGNEIARKAVRSDSEITFNSDNMPGRAWQNHGQYHLNYNRDFGYHKLSVLALYNYTSETSFTGANPQIPRKFLGYVGRTNYVFKNKYIAELSLGYNGSERFAPGKRFGLFPSASLGYRITEEEFFKELFPFINQLKLRYSHGLSGNDDLGGERWLYVTDYARSGSTLLGTSYQNYTIINEGRAASKNVTWAIARQTNAGFEMELLKNKVKFDFDYFKENRENMLIARSSVPSFYAATPPPANIGIVRKNGIELNGSVVQNINNLRITFGANLLYYRADVVFRDEPYLTPEHIKLEGKPLGTRFAYMAEGFFNSQQEIENAPTQGVGRTLGDLRYKDFNGDGILNSLDEVAVKTPEDPNLIYGFNFNFNYKGLQLVAIFQGAGNQSMRYNLDPGWPFADGGTTGAMDIHLGRWAPDNRVNPTFPIMHTSHNHYSAGRNSDFFMRRSDYLKLRTLSLSYLFSNQLLRSLHVKSLELSLNGQNLWTYAPTALEWIDPESNGRRDYYPIMGIYSIGLNVKF